MGILGVESDESKLEEARQKLATGLSFLENVLTDAFLLWWRTNILSRDIVAGSVVSTLPYFNVSLDDYPQLNAWCDRLNQRPAWVETAPSPKDVAAFISRRKAQIAKSK